MLEVRTNKLGCEGLQGPGGGLAIFSKEINLHLRRVSRFYIDVDVVEEDDFVWHFTGFYRKPKSDWKELSWKRCGCRMKRGGVHGYA